MEKISENRNSDSFSNLESRALIANESTAQAHFCTQNLARKDLIATFHAKNDELKFCEEATKMCERESSSDHSLEKKLH